jgi:nucleotide-binding universal stress UspA family protein
MYDRILVPLDGSALGEEVLPLVCTVARATEAPIELLRVFDPGLLPLDLDEPGVDPAEEFASRFQAGGDLVPPTYIQEYLDRAAEGLRADGYEVVTKIAIGEAAKSIVEETEGHPDTLIAMCTHGRSGVSRWVMGSVTDKVMHATYNPVLLVREGKHPAEAELETLVVPLDGSSLAEQALPHVVTLAKALSLKIILLRVTPSAEEYHRYMSSTPISAAATVYSAPYEEFASAADAQAMHYLHGVADELEREHLVSVEQTLLRGHAAEVITEVAQEAHHSLVVMTSHGRTGLGRWLLGSVTDRVVRHSGEPVLVVRARE